MKKRGHPVRGFISGLLLGIFIMFDLMLYKVMAPGTLTLPIIPLGLAVLGVILGIAAPFGAKEPSEA